ncbi:hypothetical protein ACFSJ3_03005 [Corallincola platygyrae]|uniref:Uncharacterized protein n=1 Tax=Corallincola platygyrae TaxID=1193278 RepID=A0ABW4XHD0_9GAMM
MSSVIINASNITLQDEQKVILDTYTALNLQAPDELSFFYPEVTVRELSTRKNQPSTYELVSGIAYLAWSQVNSEGYVVGKVVSAGDKTTPKNDPPHPMENQKQLLEELFVTLPVVWRKEIAAALVFGLKSEIGQADLEFMLGHDLTQKFWSNIYNVSPEALKTRMDAIAKHLNGEKTRGFGLAIHHYQALQPHIAALCDILGFPNQKPLTTKEEPAVLSPSGKVKNSGSDHA